MTRDEWRGTNDEIAPEPPKGDKLQKRLLFVLMGINDELRIYEIIFKQIGAFAAHTQLSLAFLHNIL